MLNKFFKFQDLSTTVKKEIIGGITTFLSMVYILSVNPSILSNSKSITSGFGNMPFDGIFLITAIVSFISTMLMGLIANLPVSLAPSMGLNSMFTFTIANNGGIGYEGALISVMISGILFVIISATKIRRLIINSIPNSIKLIITAAIGLFIAYVGFNNIGLFAISDGLPVASIGDLTKNWSSILMGIFVLIIIILLFYKKIPGSIAIAILIGLILSIIFGFTFAKNWVNSSGLPIFPHLDKSSWNYGQLKNVKEIFDNTYLAFANKSIWTNPTMYIAISVFLIVCIFDTTGTLLGVNETIKKYTPSYELSNRALLADSIGVLTSSFICSAPVTSYIESTTGIEQGARSGFSSIIVSILFLLSIVLFPIFKLIPSCVVGAATIFIGMLMFASLKKIEWEKIEIVIAGFFIIILTITTYSLVNGLAFGLIFYTLAMFLFKKTKEINWFLYIVDIIFIIYFIIMIVLQFQTK